MVQFSLVLTPVLVNAEPDHMFSSAKLLNIGPNALEYVQQVQFRFMGCMNQNQMCSKYYLSNFWVRKGEVKAS